jgi:hypothetical protein
MPLRQVWRMEKSMCMLQRGKKNQGRWKGDGNDARLCVHLTFQIQLTMLTPERSGSLSHHCAQLLQSESALAATWLTVVIPRVCSGEGCERSNCTQCTVMSFPDVAFCAPLCACCATAGAAASAADAAATVAYAACCCVCSCARLWMVIGHGGTAERIGKYYLETSVTHSDSGGAKGHSHCDAIVERATKECQQASRLWNNTTLGSESDTALRPNDCSSSLITIR